VTLDATGSTDSDGTIASYAFDCGATGVTPTGAGSKVTCTYPSVGSYTAKVTVTDNQGATGNATAMVTVGQGTAGPTAALVGGRVRQGERIRIDARGSHANGDATLVSYTFRCAGHRIGPKAGARAVCSFRHRGIHRVWVKVTDSNGMTDRAVARVRVRRGVLPVARLSLSANTVSVGDRAVAFAGSSTGSRWSAIKDVRFVCGNGQRSHWRESMTYRCRFDQAGRYRVVVVVRNTLGLRDRASEVVRVR
jgi:PKD repeat protein